MRAHSPRHLQQLHTLMVYNQKGAPRHKYYSFLKHLLDTCALIVELYDDDDLIIVKTI